MRISFLALLLLLTTEVDSKKPVRPPPATSRAKAGSRSSSNRGPPKSSKAPRRRIYEDEDPEEEDSDELDVGFPDDEEFDEEFDEEEEEEEEEVLRPMSRNRGPPRREPPRKPPPPRDARPGSRSTKPRSSAAKSGGGRSRSRDDYDEDYDRPRSSRGPRPSRDPRRRPPPGRDRRDMVPYTQQAAGTFTRGLTALKESIPNPTAVKESAASALSAARERTSKLSSTLYREVKGLTSSELEQVMLKATRPDDMPVKGKHVERLVGVTYQISSRYDIYDAVLRKLWNKMAEKDWRTTIKALYILHRFSADGAPEHQAALKARLRELRRTRDPKRKEKYFNKKQLLEDDGSPIGMKYRSFMARYSHYVMLRAQCFGGMFDEIAKDPAAKPTSGKSSKKPVDKPVTSTSLRAELLEAASLVLNAGVTCALKDGEECENTALSVERVAADLIGLTTAVATALNRTLKGKDLPKGTDAALLKKWCVFYSEELLPQTRAMVKKTSAKLDAYGLFLPSRMGASVSPEVLQKGLRLEEDEETKDVKEEAEEEEVREETEAKEEEPADVEEDEEQTVEKVEEALEEEAEEEEELEEDEYDEYYDDEEA